MTALAHTPTVDAERNEKAAQFFEHIEKARAAGKDWWAVALEKMLNERIEQDRVTRVMAAALAGIVGPYRDMTDDELREALKPVPGTTMNRISAEAARMVLGARAALTKAEGVSHG